MTTIVLLLIIVLLCCAILYAHRKHSDALEELRGLIASARAEIRKLKGGSS